MVETSMLLRLLEIDDQAEWSRTLSSLGAELGFEQVLCGIIRSRRPSMENAFIGGNYPRAWMAHYHRHELVSVDPIVRHCAINTLPVVWRPETFSTAAERAMYEEACSHHICSGISLPIHGPHGETGVISFTRGTRANSAFERDVAGALPMMSLLRDYALASAEKFFSRENPASPAPRLTRREFEILRWAMAGKSSWEISRITNCSEATVNFHIANVRQKFNVNTRQQAVVKAIALGLITPEDHHR